MVNCLKESIDVVAFSMFFDKPISIKKSVNIFQILLRLNKGIENKYISTTSTIFCKKKILVKELS